MYIKDFPNMCTGRVIVGMGGGALNNAGLTGQFSRKELVHLVNNEKTQGRGLVCATTIRSQRAAERGLEWFGFRKSEPIRSRNHNSIATLWWYPVQEFNPNDPKFKRYLNTNLGRRFVR